MDYQQAGVNVEAGRAFVERIRSAVEGTRRPGVLGNLGGFGGLFELPSGYRQPVLVSGTDGVGTKLKIAQVLDQHTTVGVDLVAMCVNDVLTLGAEPLFFLDYLATGKLEPEQLADVVSGIATGCRDAGCALLGGETAEMPGFYGAGEYDLAGFCVGIVEKDQALDGSQVQVGDVVLGLASSGVHSNGFSLVRKIVEISGLDWQQTLPELDPTRSIGEVLLTPTQIYVRPVLAALKSGLEIHGMAHITGGGLPENLPRCLGTGQSAQVEAGSWPLPPVFRWLSEVGAVPEAEMYRTFNMGIGFAVVLPATQSEAAQQWFVNQGLAAYRIGSIIPGDNQLTGLF
ncbi:phosphoribosylformylglycinamidine cyclo-ligase [Leptolyngbya sp. FACHB-261]|uniref:phosphoribosylformylglycinamidine cyclo-ligase n=1 Tax=Leptolyngbya sp. FACHB-261 TaxID=2692806 RepID=UPI0016859F18|nr:phosphoribosylformylglycinamidine cyclo-ligase [Leptolyngbya sp. FACHB-261]MBD2100720.1 phosphoribosylformylglycinamidine cyclo-ligase [Leptolyngbya sp. FACHB-261]